MQSVSWPTVFRLHICIYARRLSSGLHSSSSKVRFAGLQECTHYEKHQDCIHTPHITQQVTISRSRHSRRQRSLTEAHTKTQVGPRQQILGAVPDPDSPRGHRQQQQGAPASPRRRCRSQGYTDH